VHEVVGLRRRVPVGLGDDELDGLVALVVPGIVAVADADEPVAELGGEAPRPPLAGPERVGGLERSGFPHATSGRGLRRIQRVEARRGPTG
jgi:hypothetical protein